MTFTERKERVGEMAIKAKLALSFGSEVDKPTRQEQRTALTLLQHIMAETDKGEATRKPGDATLNAELDAIVRAAFPEDTDFPQGEAKGAGQ
jgi:hypothetical protein